MEHKFYDVHYHLFDLSHPNILAFLLHEDLIGRDTVKKVMKKFPFLLKFMPLWIFRLFPGEIVNKVRHYLQHDARNFRNLLSVMEGAIEYHFLYTEYFLTRDIKNGGNFTGAGYNKIVLCPLLIDFGYKNLNNPECFYNLPPAKPIVNQVVDMVNSMWFYYNYDLIPHPDRQGRLKIIPSVIPKEKKLFEIYPFLGINTQNYDLSEIVMLFDKYFRGYEDDGLLLRQKKLFNKSGTIQVNLEDMIFRRKEESDPDYFTYLFAGIKLYPPLGFDPWPEENKNELEKVKFLYSECVRKKLPVTVHCSDGGFITSPDAQKLTDPSIKWKMVLTRPEYRDLKINFAHLGTRYNGKNDWQETIQLYLKTGNNIFTDCSCQTPKMEDYSRVADLMNADTESGILFGSDFVINLIWSGSYNEYLGNFINTKSLTDRQKELMCESNPGRFLFG